MRKVPYALATAAITPNALGLLLLLVLLPMVLLVLVLVLLLLLLSLLLLKGAPKVSRRTYDTCELAETRWLR